jgi:hypothetical protein
VLNVLLKSPSWKKSVAFENVSPTLGIPHGMLPFSVALIRKSHRGLAIDEKKSITAIQYSGTSWFC